MERLKVLGTWILLVIAFYLFSNWLIYLCLNGGENAKTNTNNIQTVNEIKQKN